MRVRRAVVMAVVLGLVAVVSYTVPWEPSFQGPSASLSIPATSLTFRYPATWRAYRTYGYGVTVLNLAFLSTSPLHNPCVTDPRTRVKTCDGTNLIRRIPPDGVLVSWALVPNDDPPGGTRGWPGQRTMIGGQPAWLDVQRPALSRELWGCDETVNAFIANPISQRSVYGLDACLIGPHLDRTEEQVRAMLNSVRSK